MKVNFLFFKNIRKFDKKSKIYFLSILFFAGVSIWLSYQFYQGTISLYSSAEKSITELQDKRKSISVMMRSARERMIILLEMYIEQDSFERYEKRQKMNLQAQKYIYAKELFEVYDLSIEQELLFRDISDLVGLIGPVQMEAAELMILEEMAEVDELIFNTAIPYQTKLMLKFEELLNLVEENTVLEISSMKKLLNSTNKNVILIVLLVVVGSFFSFMVIITQANKREKELRQLVHERTIDLEKAHARTNSLIENAPDGVISIDQSQNIVTYNPTAKNIFLYDKDEVIGKPLLILLPDKSKSVHRDLVMNFHKDESTNARMMDAREEVLGQRKDGTTFPAEISISKSYIGDEVFFTAFVRDVTEKRKAQEKIIQLARYDSLTGLYNRHYFEEKLNDSIKYNKRFPEQGFCLMMMDLDLFKQVNDTFGHLVGDKLLKHIGNILKGSVREIDDVGRIGGDEFAIILQGVTEDNFAINIANNLISEISSPIVIDNHEIKIGVSIGITYCQNGDYEKEALLKQADKMLYASKNAGKNTYRIFSGL